MSYVQSCAVGQHVKTSQKLLNEISAARLRLLDKKKKAAYDGELKQKDAALQKEQEQEAEQKQRRRNVSRDSKRRSKGPSPSKSSSGSSVAVQEPGIVIDSGGSNSPGSSALPSVAPRVSTRNTPPAQMPLKAKVAIAGVVLLAVLSTVATGAFLFMRTSDTPVAKGKKPPASEDAAAAAAANADETEPLGEGPLTVALGEDPAAEDPDPAPDTTEPTEPPDADKPSATATNEPETPDPAKPKDPETDEPAAKPPETAKPPEPKKTPPPPKPVEPFKTFPKTVSLPEVASVDEAVLGQITVPKDDTLFVNLVGGKLDKPEVEFTLTEIAGAEQPQWQIKLSNADGSTHIADIKLDGKDLKFAWSAEAGSLEESGLLRNGVLEVRTRKAPQHYTVLRQYTKVEPVTLSFGPRDKNTAEVILEDIPDPKRLQVEITSFEGPFQDPKVRPSAKFSADLSRGEDVGIGVGSLAIMVTSNANSKKVTLGFDPKFQMQGMERPQPLKQADGMLTGANIAVTRLTAQLEAAKKNKLPAQQLAIGEQQLQAAMTSSAELQSLAQSCQALDKNGKIHFRVFLISGNQEVDIARTNAPVEAPAEKKKK